MTNSKTLYSIHNSKLRLNLHEGQQRAWLSERRFVFMLAGTQGGKTSFGPWWQWREIQRTGGGDHIAATSSYDLFKLKMLPEMLNVFEHVLGIGRYWAGDKVLEIANPETGEFDGKRSDDPRMWARVILRSAASKGGMESTTARSAWLDEVGQDDFSLAAWEGIMRRLSIWQGRVLGTTTPYNLGWVKQQIFDPWEKGDPDIDIIQFASIQNPIFPKAEFERARRTLPKWKFKMFYRGLFERPAGMIYSDFIDKDRDQGGHKIKPFDLPLKWPRFVGVDPGAVHTAMIWGALDTENGFLYIYRESLEGGKSSEQHAKGAIEKAEQGRENVVFFAIGQKSEVQQRLDWAAAGVRNVMEPPFHDVESGIDKIISLLKQHRIFFFDDLELTLDEIGRYARVLDVNSEPTPEIKNKAQFHLLDALRYLVARVTYIEYEQTVYNNSVRVVI